LIQPIIDNIPHDGEGKYSGGQGGTA